MKKDIKDYLHLYLGQEVKMNRTGIIKNLDILTLNDIELKYIALPMLILRPLSDMTEEEKMAFDYRHGEGAENHQYYPSDFLYLLKQGFDLFGLIEAGLAIDKTTLK